MNDVKCTICGHWHKLRKGEHRYDGKPKLCSFCKRTYPKKEIINRLRSMGKGYRLADMLRDLQ